MVNQRIKKTLLRNETAAPVLGPGLHFSISPSHGDRTLHINGQSRIIRVTPAITQWPVLGIL